MYFFLFVQPIPIRKRLAMTLWRLATGCEYRSIQEIFGVGRSTACDVFHECVRTMTRILTPMFLRLPTQNEFKDISQVFRDKWNFPMICGAIDSTHIPIIAPTEHRHDYYNRKGWYSVICQAVCDGNYLFWDLDVGWPGKVHDARVFANSTIYEKGSHGNLLPNTTERFMGVEVPFMLVGDPAYPLQPWLMKPFPENPQTTDDQKHFNYRLARARMVVECAFGKLKGRWRCLLKRNDSHVSLIPDVVLACATLHNICQREGDLIEDETPEGPDLPQPPFQPVEDRDDAHNRAHRIRNALCSYLSRHRP